MGSRWRVIGKPWLTDPPVVAACYAIYGDGQLVYVGSTENLRTRITAGHAIGVRRYSSWIDTPWGAFRNVTIKYRPSRKYGDWAMIELRLIRRLQPSGNRRGILRTA